MSGHRRTCCAACGCLRHWRGAAKFLVRCWCCGTRLPPQGCLECADICSCAGRELQSGQRPFSPRVCAMRRARTRQESIPPQRCAQAPIAESLLGHGPDARQVRLDSSQAVGRFSARVSVPVYPCGGWCCCLDSNEASKSSADIGREAFPGKTCSDQAHSCCQHHCEPAGQFELNPFSCSCAFSSSGAGKRNATGFGFAEIPATTPRARATTRKPSI